MARRKQVESERDIDVARLARTRDSLVRRLEGLEAKRVAGRPTSPDWFEAGVRYRLAEVEALLGETTMGDDE